MSQSMVPSAWLAQWPLQPEERLYAVLGSASEARPLNAWQTLAPRKLPHSIWAGTAYAEWVDVMPYVGIVEPGSAFLDWVASAEATDWGWLAVSSSPPETVAAHLQGLTKVLLPDEQAVFLRFWDGAQWLPILQKLGDEAGRVLPVFQRYLINGQPLAVSTGPATAAKASPWWQVPASLLAHLAEHSPQVLIGNLLQWLEEQRPDLYTAFRPATLRHKVAYFSRRPDVSPQALADYLASELS
ncbi:DUF4123 domain-containing protein [Pseudomonas sp. PA-6-1D]|uniref:DUF4123 domain-containing protein n=1 Tax=Pseudomonas TaxID=286 RepID=UPI001EF0889B|nr:MULTISPECIES: DUF4123 domain-containing protein [Pseudomonas]MCF5141022.1 DUF4123 domain-containing protein [Pseudomonas sp. PA-6-3C]MCF5146613.1 DUF4123 domain-containing protein [Pseudomonas sp. PA-6-3F]MCF5158741.1 DUF4123 domain-containing protein [Pseudomonas sp. PA-6-2E]MCF5175890.1 DUF4123 domain-containing protein [Pseudomonas sp. PA-6-1D]MCF5190333.1 DUF4123 domain-containing protein [Pseudomonas sp. PA-6-1H]